jgi:hypothetical protein
LLIFLTLFYIVKKNFMKKSVLLYLISLLSSLVILLGCSASENSASDDQSGTNFVTGELLMVNNEPFARIALMNDTSLFLLDCPDGIKDILYNNQGKKAKVFYSSVSTNQEKIKVLKVDKVEIINNK